MDSYCNETFSPFLFGVSRSWPQMHPWQTARPPTAYFLLVLWTQVAGTRHQLYPKWRSGWLLGQSLLAKAKVFECSVYSWSGNSSNVGAGGVEQVRKDLIWGRVILPKPTFRTEHMASFPLFCSMKLTSLRPRCRWRVPQGPVVFVASVSGSDARSVCSSTLCGSWGKPWPPCGHCGLTALFWTHSTRSWLWVGFFHSGSLSTKGHIF